MESRAMKEIFIGVLKRAKLKYRFQLKDFTIMGNHVHFIVKPEDEECLSRIMQWILGVFAMTYNRIMGLTGHVWGERFKSRIITDFADFLRTLGYIDANPVRIGLVATPEDWPYGGPGFRKRDKDRLMDALA